ncbi:MAG: CarD family transcriptional regulator [Solirubrobacteraceae bacterium]
MEEHLEDFDEIEPLAQVEFEIGDSVVYPHHGAGKVMRKEMKEVLGCVREYLTIKILHNDMTVMVPTENAALAGLRRVIDEETVQKVLAVLKDECSEMPKNWNRRFKHNRDKIKTGDIYELAEVVRNLAIRELQKGLSTGEKQMFTRAKKILSSELMYALAMNEEEVEEHLSEVLETSLANQPATVVQASRSNGGDTSDAAEPGAGEDDGAQLPEDEDDGAERLTDEDDGAELAGTDDQHPATVTAVAD